MKITVRSGQDSGRSGALGDSAFVIGRDDSCDLTLADDKVSRRHASVELDGDRVTLRDLGSTNGVFVGGLRVTDASELKVGQPFRVGDTVLAVEADAARPAARPAPVAPSPVPPPSWAGGGASPRPDGGRSDAVGTSTSTFRRMMLERSVRRTSILASLLAVVVVVLVVLLVTGVLPPDDKGDSGNQSVTSIVRTALPSTVLVTTRIGNSPASSGTGWFLDADRGLVVTNNHVIGGGTSWRVRVRGVDHRATFVATAPCEDLAVLRIQPRPGLRTMPLGSQSDLQQGDHVVALGYPANASQREDLSTSDGIVSVVHTRTKGVLEELPNVVRTTAAINPGNSGGPLLNLQGELVGVNTLGASRQSEGYAIGVDRVKQVVPRLRAGRSQFFTGFSLLPTSELPEGLLTPRGLPDVDGYFVIGAVPGTPASGSAILNQAALIVGVNGRRIDGTTSAYCKAVRRRSPPVFQYVVPGSTQVHSAVVPFTR